MSCICYICSFKAIFGVFEFVEETTLERNWKKLHHHMQESSICLALASHLKIDLNFTLSIYNRTRFQCPQRIFMTREHVATRSVLVKLSSYHRSRFIYFKKNAIFDMEMPSLSHIHIPQSMRIAF